MMSFILATNVIASRPPERQPTGTPKPIIRGSLEAVKFFGVLRIPSLLIGLKKNNYLPIFTSDATANTYILKCPFYLIYDELPE